MRTPLLLSLAGSAVLAGFSVAALPFSRGLFRAPRTPYDASEATFTVPAWILLRRAAEVVPPEASVVVRTEPPDATNDSYLHRFAVALLPGRLLNRGHRAAEKAARSTPGATRRLAATKVYFAPASRAAAARSSTTLSR